MVSKRPRAHGMKNRIMPSFSLALSPVDVSTHYLSTIIIMSRCMGLIYVDDILVIDSSSKLIHAIINKPHDKFALKKLGTPQYFPGIEVHHQANGTLFLTQTKYIRRLLAKANMIEVKGVATHMFI